MATAEAKLQVPEFANEPFIDFSNAENRKRMEAALAKVKAEFGHEYPMWIAGKKVVTAGKRKSTNPSRPSEVIGVFQDASKEQAIEAIEAANKYFDVWKKVPAQERAKCLFKAAAIVREAFQCGNRRLALVAVSPRYKTESTGRAAHVIGHHLHISYGSIRREEIAQLVFSGGE